jgi:hypothetical protein
MHKGGVCLYFHLFMDVRLDRIRTEWSQFLARIPQGSIRRDGCPGGSDFKEFFDRTATCNGK